MQYNNFKYELFIIQYLTNKVESICVTDRSFFWFQDFKKVLQKNVVAYISIHSPLRGNSSLHPVASPSLQQLVVEVRWTTIVSNDYTKLPFSLYFGISWFFHLFLKMHQMFCILRNDLLLTFYQYTVTNFLCSRILHLLLFYGHNSRIHESHSYREGVQKYIF